MLTDYVNIEQMKNAIVALHCLFSRSYIDPNLFDLVKSYMKHLNYEVNKEVMRCAVCCQQKKRKLGHKFIYSLVTCNRASQSVVFNTSQKMALRAFYLIRILTKSLTYYYINRSQRHLFVAIENNGSGGPIAEIRELRSKQIMQLQIRQ